MEGLRPAALAGDDHDWAGPAAPATADGAPNCTEDGMPAEELTPEELEKILNTPVRGRSVGDGGMRRLDKIIRLDSPEGLLGEEANRERGESGAPSVGRQFSWSATSVPSNGSAGVVMVHSTSLVNHDATFKSLPAEQVSSFLEARGFLCVDELNWRLAKQRDWADIMPRVSFSVKKHEEAGAHTWYGIETELSVPLSEQRLSWKAPRRLAHLRDFHDHLKALLGRENYDNMFLDREGCRVTFASRGGVPGTTARLDAWLSALAIAINYGRTSPTVVALALHFLRAPAFGMEPEVEQDIEEEVVEAFSPDILGHDVEALPESPHPHHPGPAM